MSIANNVHKLLSNGADTSFIDELTPEVNEESRILSARRTIRSHLRDEFAALSRNRSIQVQFGLLKQDPFAAQPLLLRPKFFTQGSFAYGTWNAPAHRPPQEIDLDDGMYLPLSVFEQAGSPKVASAALFDVMDHMLGDLCRRQGWKLVNDKKTCCRIDLGFGAHVDIPLYAVPDEDTRLLEKAAESLNFMAHDGRIALATAFSRQPEVFRLSSDKVWLAHRTKGWHQSDPRQLHDWFQQKTQIYGDQLRRVCRYVKAWRDWYAKESPLSSIALMAHVVQVFETVDAVEDRDDLTLLSVAERLPTLLATPVPNPVSPAQMLDDSLTVVQRQQATNAAEIWRGTLVKSLSEIFDARRVIETLQQAFGPRIPTRPDLVQIASGEKVVRSVAPTILPTREIPGRSVSG